MYVSINKKLASFKSWFDLLSRLLRQKCRRFLGSYVSRSKTILWRGQHVTRERNCSSVWQWPLNLIVELSDALTAAITPAWSLLGSPPNCHTSSSLLVTHLYLVIVDISEMDGKSLECVHSASPLRLAFYNSHNNWKVIRSLLEHSMS